MANQLQCTDTVTIIPQVLTPIDEDWAQSLLDDERWWVQEKFDGKRILVRKDGNEITGWNRKGLPAALPPSLIARAKASRAEQFLMDGELVGDSYIAFDLLECEGADLRPEPYRIRLLDLAGLIDIIAGAVLTLAATAVTSAEKRRLLQTAREQGKEGVVFKHCEVRYIPGRTREQLKLKFTATASCLVAGPNGMKRSVALTLLDQGRSVVVGNVAIPVDQPMPAAGNVIEVRYLYAYRGGCLYQPVCLGIRDDVGLEACTLDQLKYKGEN